MIDDVVELPRPLKRFKQGATLASYCVYDPPTSEFGIEQGVSVDVKDMPIGIGNEFDLIVGKDTPYRYKMIEHDDDFIREFVAIADGPITSADTKLFNLWVNRVDKKTLLVTRHYFWSIIEAVRNYFGFQKCELLSKTTQDEMRLTGVFANYPGLENHYNWSHLQLDPQSSESSEIDRMHMLKANMRAMETITAFGDMFFNPLDVYRGTNKEIEPYRLVTASGKFLSREAIAPKELKRLLGPDYGTKSYHQCIRPTKQLRSNTIIDAMTEMSGWFDVLKYIEFIPYGESFASIINNKIDVMRVFDPYDRMHFIDLSQDKLETLIGSNFGNLIRDLSDMMPTYKRISIYRSWSEEVYITILNQDRTTMRFYFDLVYAAMGSRMFAPVT